MNKFINSLSIVIVVYNTVLEDSESFESVRQMSLNYRNLDVFIYDNSVSPQILKEFSNLQVTYHHDPQNSGVSKAYNAGAVHAKKLKKEWVLLLDQDTTLSTNILSVYEKSIQEHPTKKMIAPILKLHNGKIFSPCAYRFKRGFYLDTISAGIHSFDKLSLVNSGILVHLDAFFEVGGYNEKVKLDFSDFQFIERFKKVHKDFVVMNVTCQQDFSDDEADFSSQAIRFRFYCEGARNIEEKSIWDWFQYNTVVFVRALRLTSRYWKGSFLKTYFSKFLFASGLKQ